MLTIFSLRKYNEKDSHLLLIGMGIDSVFSKSNLKMSIKNCKWFVTFDLIITTPRILDSKEIIRCRSRLLVNVLILTLFIIGNSWASLVAQLVKNLPSMWETGFDPCVRKIPWRRKWQPTPVLLHGRFHGRRSLVGYSPWGHKESYTIEQLHFMYSTHYHLLAIQSWARQFRALSFSFSILKTKMIITHNP